MRRATLSRLAGAAVVTLTLLAAGGASTAPAVPAAPVSAASHNRHFACGFKSLIVHET